MNSTRWQTLDLIQKGCFDQVTTGRHSLLSRHKFLGSLEMNGKFVGSLITVLKRVADKNLIYLKDILCYRLFTNENQWKSSDWHKVSYVGDICQGHIINAFADLLRGAVGSLGQSLSAHFFKQTLRCLKGHQEVPLQLSPVEKTRPISSCARIGGLRFRV